MRGADKQLPLVAAATVAPLLGERHGDIYDMVRPPTRLVIAIDQDPNWNTAAKIEKQRRKIIAEIAKVVAAQGAVLSPDDLETLVVVRQWNARCFEYAHFTDDELAAAIRSTHPTCGGLAQPALVARVAETRKRGGDIGQVWDNTWVPKPSKRELAQALWQTLRTKIDSAHSGTAREMPQVADVVHEAYLLAQQAAFGTYVIRAAKHPPKLG